MPVSPASRFANLPVIRVQAPDGSPRLVIALRLTPSSSENVNPYQFIQGDSIDLLAQRFYGDEGLWWRILDANPLIYPLDIQPNNALNIPAPGPATRITRTRRF